jgi:K+-transporting ATPase c subunit
MLALLRPAAVLLGLLTVATGVIYPLTVTGVAQALFAAQANGTLFVANGRVVGSRWVGQPFDEPRYFWGGPLASGLDPDISPQAALYQAHRVALARGIAVDRLKPWSGDASRQEPWVCWASRVSTFSD